MKLSFGEISEATGGRGVGKPLSGSMRIVTDTRSIQRGDAFIALRGERFDGADFVDDAFDKGAALAIVSREETLGGHAGIVVDDTLRAYMALGAAARAHTRAIVVAITGSTGKTTTKSLLAQLLSIAGKKVAATPQNENNEIGVTKMLLALEGDEEIAVVEMGCRHDGEIAELVKIAQPHVGVLTNIGEAHLELFKTRERLAETKWGLFSGDAVAILNLDDSESRRRADSLKNTPGWFGAGAHDEGFPTPATLIPTRHELVFVDDAGADAYRISTTLPGEHNLANLAAAATVARVTEIEPQTIADAIPSLTLPPGRYERMTLPGGARVVYDAYNASLSGTLATLRAFASETASRRIAVLGGMAELGDESPQMHEQIGKAAKEFGIDVLLAGGEHAIAIVQGALSAGMQKAVIVAYDNNNVATDWLRANLREGDAILLKGSRMYKMEEILAGVQARN